MRNANEQTFFKALYDTYVMHNFEQEVLEEYHPAISYLSVAEQCSIPSKDADEAVRYWIQVGWLTHDPPAAICNNCSQLNIGGDLVYFTREGEHQARDLGKSVGQSPNETNSELAGSKAKESNCTIEDYQPQYEMLEAKAIRWLASKYPQGEMHIYNQTAHDFAEHLGLDTPDLTYNKPLIALWQRLCDLGAIQRSDGGPAMFIGGITSPKVLDLAKSINNEQGHIWNNWSDGKKWLMGIIGTLVAAVITAYLINEPSNQYGDSPSPNNENSIRTDSGVSPHVGSETGETESAVNKTHSELGLDQASLTNQKNESDQPKPDEVKSKPQIDQTDRYTFKADDKTSKSFDGVKFGYLSTSSPTDYGLLIGGAIEVKKDGKPQFSQRGISRDHKSWSDTLGPGNHFHCTLRQGEEFVAETISNFVTVRLVQMPPMENQGKYGYHPDGDAVFLITIKQK